MKTTKKRGRNPGLQQIIRLAGAAVLFLSVITIFHRSLFSIRNASDPAESEPQLFTTDSSPLSSYVSTAPLPNPHESTSPPDPDDDDKSHHQHRLIENFNSPSDIDLDLTSSSPSSDDVHMFNNNNYNKRTPDKRFLSHLIVSIGAQKAGTSSLQKLLDTIPEIWAPRTETHYFDALLLREKHDMDSFDTAIDKFYAYGMGCIGYTDLLKSRSITISTNDDGGNKLNKTKTRLDFVVEKTPSHFLYPHTAYLFASEFVHFGTKFIVLLRDPTKRLISSYCHEKKMHNTRQYWKFKRQYVWDNRLTGYLDRVIYNESINGGNNSFVQFNRDLDRLYDEYSGYNNIGSVNSNVNQSKVDSAKIESQQHVLFNVMQRYKEFLYYHTSHYDDMPLAKHGLFHFYYIWIRSCYAPQLITWMYYMEEMNPSMKYRNSIKVIQSERYFGDDTFHLTMKYLLCYVHYYVDTDDYQQWMEECVQNDRYHAMRMESVQTNSKAGDGYLNVTEDHIERISKSFGVCDKWLWTLLDEQYPNVILEKFDRDLWNQS